jgi:hypothetical protein
MILIEADCTTSVVQAMSALAIAEICRNNKGNQDLLYDLGWLPPPTNPEPVPVPKS